MKSKLTVIALVALSMIAVVRGNDSEKSLWKRLSPDEVKWFKANHMRPIKCDDSIHPGEICSEPEPAKPRGKAGQDLYPKRLEFAKAAALKAYGAPECQDDGEPCNKRMSVDVRSKWEGGATSMFVIALACSNCDVNEVYAVIASDSAKETKVIHVDTED